MRADLRIPFPCPLVIRGGSNLPEGQELVGMFAYRLVSGHWRVQTGVAGIGEEGTVTTAAEVERDALRRDKERLSTKVKTLEREAAQQARGPGARHPDRRRRGSHGVLGMHAQLCSSPCYLWHSKCNRRGLDRGCCHRCYI